MMKGLMSPPLLVWLGISCTAAFESGFRRKAVRTRTVGMSHPAAILLPGAVSPRDNRTVQGAFVMRINLREKVFIPLCLALICLGAVMYFMTSIYLKRISTEFAAQIGRSKALEISAAMDAAGKNALGMASVFTKLQPVQRAYQIALSGEIDDENDPMVQQAREMLRNELMHHLLGYETVIGESVRIHFHLPNGRSLVRLWQKGNIQRDGQWVDGSDDLSATRSSVMEANLKRRVVQGLELGSDGFHLVSVLPLTSTRGEHMGSVEVEMDFGSILKGASASNGQHLMLYLNGEHAGAVPMLHDASKHPKIGDHFVQVSGAKDPGKPPWSPPRCLPRPRTTSACSWTAPTP
jgi:hypothetical protein